MPWQRKGDWRHGEWIKRSTDHGFFSNSDIQAVREAITRGTVNHCKMMCYWWNETISNAVLGGHVHIKIRKVYVKYTTRIIKFISTYAIKLY